MFDDRPFVYGRLPKLLLAWMFGMQMWAGYYLYHVHSKNQMLQGQTRKNFRKVVPFVQAMEDVKFVAL